MSKSPSGTSSTTTTSTEQKDQRVSATDQAIAIGAGGQLQVNDEFSDRVLTAFQRIVDLAENAGLVAAGFAKDAQAAQNKAIEQVAERAKTSEEIENTNRVTLMRVLTFLGLGGTILLAYPLVLKKKRR